MYNPHRSSCCAPMDTQIGGLLLANMLAAWLKSGPGFLSTAETVDEPQDHGTAPAQTGVRVPPPVHPRPSASPSREHGTPVCSARESTGVGLERSCDPHPRPRPGNVGFSDGGERRLQDLSGGGPAGGRGGPSFSRRLAAVPLLSLPASKFWVSWS